MLNNIVEYWPVYVGIIAVIAVVVIAAVAFCNLPSSEQKTKILVWMLGAVTEAEKQLGGGTGKLKLAEVYSKFKEAFGFISIFMSFERFSGLVDEALISMRKMLEENTNVANYVNENKVG